MVRFLSWLLLAAILVAAPGARAQSTAQVVAATLDNGLRVLLLEDHRNALVSFQVWYRVGSRNEQRGVSGLAHVLEHMMFKGTARHGPREFARLVEQNGGQDNAFTTTDVTSYYVNIAADKIDLVIDLEADRMHNLTLAPADIDSEREVVIEERRTRTDDDPGGYLGEEVSSIAYKAHPYGTPIIGWLEDIRRITPAQVRAFYTTYYVPNNALVVAVGDFSAERVLRAIRDAFGAIPRGAPPPPILAVEPPQNGERRVTVTKEAQLPIVYLGYHVPSHRDKDAFALDLLSSILSSGRASRIYRQLVHERQLALDAGGDYSYFAFDPSLFWFWATPMPGQTPQTLEKALLDELERLKREPVSEEELTRAKNQTEAAFVFQADSVHRRASLLARFELIGGYALEDSFVPMIRTVSADDIQRVARAYFTDDNKSVGVLVPKGK